MADQEPPPSRAPEPPPPNNPDVSQSFANARAARRTRLTPGGTPGGGLGGSIRESSGSTTRESRDTTPVPPTGNDAIAVGEQVDVKLTVGEAPRPVEESLRDPLGEVARKERRSLLGISAVAILVGWADLVPQKFENLGITFTVPQQRAFLWVSFGVVVYYTLAFRVYAIPDVMRFRYALYQKVAELRNPAPGGANEPPLRADQVWGWVRYVSRVSMVRLVFDFIVPLLIAGFALLVLGCAVLRIENKPTTPKSDQGYSYTVAPAKTLC